MLAAHGATAGFAAVHIFASVKYVSGRTRSAFAMPYVASAAHWSAFALICATAQLCPNRRAPAARSSLPASTSVTSRRRRTAACPAAGIVPVGYDSASHFHRRGGGD
ncbi:MAG: hypothetical protein JWR70_1321 [Modestobacter sp.]|jgi:ferric-dicitrate binding protein FerR (iron transport regulator)|nr:hypothetical protein [Modestobacter sp.]